MAAFPFYLLAPLEARGSIGPIFNFFLGDFLETFRPYVSAGSLRQGHPLKT